MILLISYDLIQPEKTSDYDTLARVIRDNAGEGNYVKALYSQWFVDTNKSIREWNEIIKNGVDANDRRMIVQLYDVPTGRYMSAAVDWINERFSK